jgi:hypothetical protein
VELATFGQISGSFSPNKFHLSLLGSPASLWRGQQQQQHSYTYYSFYIYISGLGLGTALWLNNVNVTYRWDFSHNLSQNNNIYFVFFVCVGPRKRVYCSLQAYCTYPMCVQCSHFHRHEAPRHNDAGDPSSEMWNLLGEKCPVIWLKVASSTLL